MLNIRIDGDGIDRFYALAKQLSDAKLRRIYSRSINDAGNKTATTTGRALADQSGLKRSAGRRALKKRTRSTPASLSFEINVSGGAIRYKYFKGTRETKKGVSTTPRGERTLLSRHFVKAGWSPTRITKSNWNGHVMTVSSSNRSGVSVARSDVFLPEEVLIGETAKTFEDGKKHLDKRVTHHLMRLSKGALS